MTEAQADIASGNLAKAEAKLTVLETGLNNAVAVNPSLANTVAVDSLRHVVAEAKGMTNIMTVMAAKSDIANTVNSTMTSGMNIAKADASGMSQLSQVVNVAGLMDQAKSQIATGNYADAEATLSAVETGVNRAVIANPTLGNTPAVEALRNVVAEAKGMTNIMPVMAAKADIVNTVNTADDSRYGYCQS